MSRPRVPKKKPTTVYPIHCSSCGTYLFDVHDEPGRVRAFCPSLDDPWCAVTAERFYPNDRDNEWIVFALEVLKVSLTEFANDFGLTRHQANAVRQNYNRRVIAAPQ